MGLWIELELTEYQAAVHGSAIEHQGGRDAAITVFLHAVAGDVACVDVEGVLEALAGFLGGLGKCSFHFWREESFEADPSLAVDAEGQFYLGLD